MSAEKAYRLAYSGATLAEEFGSTDGSTGRLSCQSMVPSSFRSAALVPAEDDASVRLHRPLDVVPGQDGVSEATGSNTS